MVERQLARHGVQDPRVLEAMARIPRHLFLPASAWELAYAPQAVDIGGGQTISQPYIVATMTQALQLSGRESVLEIGTGSGYQGAILGWLTELVVSIERIESLAHGARRVLDELGLSNVHVVVGDGSAPHAVDILFDRIVVTAAAPSISPVLLDRLADPGILVCPVGDRLLQTLHVLRRAHGRDEVDVHEACRFVPLLGDGGFAPD